MDLEKDKLITHMLECLESPRRELTKWEDDFILSINEQWTERRWLSDRQFEILERIYAEKTS